jgi:mannosyltransferase OCH1-like enzyme
MIPTRLIRTVPEKTTDEVEAWWDEACAMHPTWQHLTLRDPIPAEQFPLTSPHWAKCDSGAQLAGLVRLEALWRWGGVYIDSDVEVYRPFTSLLGCQVFAGYEDPGVVPDAVLGACGGHPVIRACIDLALTRLNSGVADWRTGTGAWATGPGVTTTLFAGRPDVLLMPPGAFYPVHYTDKVGVDWSQARERNPWAFCAHRWHHSWR